MLKNLRVVVSHDTNPHNNVALETYLLHTVKPDECILYLWVSRRTALIGRNQNARAECHLDRLAEDDGFVVRRLSGGGTVFQDIGNANFTFLVHDANYNLQKQLSVILTALKSLGIDAIASGRNDLTVDGRKFSGNAFYAMGERRYHHGTLMIQVDMDLLSRYLNVAPDKLRAKGIASVRSRVMNLTEKRPDLTKEMVFDALTEAFGTVYGLTPEPMELEDIPAEALRPFLEKFSSDAWNLGLLMEYTHTLGDRFPWGELRLRFHVVGEEIKEVEAISDALDPHFIARIPELLTGCVFSTPDMTAALEKLPNTPETEMMRTDILSLLQEKPSTAQ